MYALIRNGLVAQYPYSIAQFRDDHRSISLPVSPTKQQLEEVGVYEVAAKSAPAISVSESVSESSPALVDGVWTQQWVVAQLDPATAAVNKAAAQQAKWEAIKAKRDKLKEGGVKVGSDWFHSDTFSRTQQIGLVMMGAAVPAIQWKTMDNTFVTMSQTLAGQIFQAVATADANLFAIAEGKRLAMMALDDPSTYDVDAGWPETHA